MSKAEKEVMSPAVECVGEGESVSDAAQKMVRPGVGTLPICGQDERLKGMLADRDELIGIVSRGDLGREQAGELLETISS